MKEGNIKNALKEKNDREGDYLPSKLLRMPEGRCRIKCCGEGDRVEVAVEGDKTAGEDDRLLVRARVGWGLKGRENLPSIGEGGFEPLRLESISAPEERLRDTVDELERFVFTNSFGEPILRSFSVPLRLFCIVSSSSSKERKVELETSYRHIVWQYKTPHYRYRSNLVHDLLLCFYAPTPAEHSQEDFPRVNEFE